MATFWVAECETIVVVLFDDCWIEELEPHRSHDSIRSERKTWAIHGWSHRHRIRLMMAPVFICGVQKGTTTMLWRRRRSNRNQYKPLRYTRRFACYLPFLWTLNIGFIILISVRFATPSRTPTRPSITLHFVPAALDLSVAPCIFKCFRRDQTERKKIRREIHPNQYVRLVSMLS